MFDFGLEPKMVGREEELKELQSYLDKTAEGHGNVLFIPGEAGVGKTRLLNELKQIAQSKGFQVLSGNSMFESLTPYMPFIDALRSGGLESLFAEEAPRVEAVYLVTHSGLLIKEVMREETELNPEIFASMLTTVGNFVKESLSMLSGKEKGGALNTLGYENYRIIIESGEEMNLVSILTGKENEFLIDDMREMLQSAGKKYGNVLKDWDGDEKKVSGIERILEPLITSGKYDGIYYGKRDPKARRNLLFENVSMGIIRHTQATPTLLCIEDLQWADPSTLALMHYVARNTKESKLLILGTYRPEDVAIANGKGHPLINTMQLMDREDLYKVLELNRLPKENISEFLTSLLGEIDFEQEFMDRIYKETEGNPLFLIQLVRFLLEERIVKPDNETWKLAKKIEDINIPPKIYNVILRRLDRVEDESRKILDFASVIGETFSSIILADLLNLEKIQLLEQLREIEHKHRLFHPYNGDYKFTHAKIKEVLYDELPLELRREYHSAIANYIEDLNKDNLNEVIEDLAFHYYNCRNKEKALHYLIKAAEKAKREYSNEEAIRFYSQVLEFDVDAQKRIGILEDLGDIYGLIGEYDKGIESYKNSLKYISDKKRMAEIKAKIGGTYEHKGEYGEGLRVCNDALSLVKNEDCREEGFVYSTMGVLYERKCEYDQVIKHLEKSLRIAEKVKDQKTAANCLNTMGFSFHFQGNFPKALEYLNKALPIWEDIGDQYGTLMCHKNIGASFSRIGDFDKALEHLGKALEIADKIGNQNGAIHCLGEMGFIYMDRTEWEKAIKIYEKTLRIGNKTGDLWAIAASYASFSNINIQSGKYDDALLYLEKSTELAKAMDYKRGLGANYSMYAEYYLNKNNFNKAQEFIDQAMKLFKDFGIMDFLTRAQYIQGMIFREQKKWDESIKAFESCIHIFNKIGIKCYDLGNAYYQFALMWKAKGEDEKAKLYLNKALDVSEQLKIKMLAEKARTDLKNLQG